MIVIIIIHKCGGNTQRSSEWKSLLYHLYKTLQDRSSHSLFTDEETEAGEEKTFAQDPTGCE